MRLRKFLAICLLNFFVFTLTSINAQKVYKPTWESLDAHEIPKWYEDSKIGLSLHWGVYSVPAWAPRLNGISYAEWYGNRMKDPKNPTYAYHLENYGLTKWKVIFIFLSGK